MVLEHAVITVRPGTHREFEAALAEARRFIAASPGFRTLALHRGVEHEDEYVLLVEWDTLDDHLTGFRGSEAFTEWRALIGPFFASPPVGTHLVPVDGLS
jgi:heme-degrading monooxygenase HmoA